VRHTLIGGDKKMILYNDLEPSEKVRVYDSGYNHKAEEERNRIIVDYRTGDVFIPKLSGTEALFSVAKDFVNSIKNNKEPLANGKLGLEVVKILQASQESIKNKGKEVMIK
jgi:predicted dehydrogenase